MRQRHGPVEASPDGAGCHGPAMPWLAGLGAAACAAQLVFAVSPQDAVAAKPAPKPPVASGSFTDHFDAYDATRWSKADGWKNGAPFDNAWAADHVTIAGGKLDLRLDDVAVLGEPFTSGELRTNGYYGYGCYEASFKPIAVPGVVTSLFTFAGPYDNGGNGKHNEIDVEFLGDKPGRVQLNFWTNDDAYTSRNEILLDLGWDPTAEFHRYGFKWTASPIEWYVDGNLVHTAFHIADADCSLADAPTEAPPPSGSASTMSVREIALSLESRATQVIARVNVVDGLGRPVAGAAVAGAVLRCERKRRRPGLYVRRQRRELRRDYEVIPTC